MVNNTPNEIKEYYIAYFDLLGNKEYLKNNPDKVADFLNLINQGIKNTIEYVQKINDLFKENSNYNIDIKTKIFSDNVLLCMDTSDCSYDKFRLLLFISIVAEIQRGFVLQCGIFLRGGIVKGNISFNDDYVFGQGLVDVVDMENKAFYTRIIVSCDLVSILNINSSYSNEEAERAISIEERLKSSEKICNEDQIFYQKMLLLANREYALMKWFQKLVLFWDDGVFILSYLSQISAQDFFNQKTINLMIDYIRKFFPSLNTKEMIQYTKEMIQSGLNDKTFEFLMMHKRQIESQLKQYGNYRLVM